MTLQLGSAIHFFSLLGVAAICFFLFKLGEWRGTEQERTRWQAWRARHDCSGGRVNYHAYKKPDDQWYLEIPFDRAIIIP